jgi:hypothetical protein
MTNMNSQQLRPWLRYARPAGAVRSTDFAACSSLSMLPRLDVRVLQPDFTLDHVVSPWLDIAAVIVTWNEKMVGRVRGEHNAYFPLPPVEGWDVDGFALPVYDTSTLYVFSRVFPTPATV